MLDSVGGLESKMLSILSLDSISHLLLNMCECWMNNQNQLSLTIKIMNLIIMNISL
jgi:hypothetical protein